MGHATSCVILSTVRYADRDPQVHDLLMEKVFSRQATAAMAQDVIRAFNS